MELKVALFLLVAIPYLTLIFKAATAKPRKRRSRVRVDVIDSAQGIKKSYIERKFIEAWNKMDKSNCPPDTRRLLREHWVTVNNHHYRIDFVNVKYKVAIELDGEKFHAGKEEYDAFRQRELESAGWRFIRFTGSDVCNAPEWVVQEAMRFIIGSRFSQN